MILTPESSTTITTLTITNPVGLMIGPEGGFSAEEIAWAILHQCIAVSLGPRVLRTETAGIVAMTGIQMQFGDLR